MRKTALFLLLLTFISCSPFSENRVLKHKKDLNNLVTKFEKYNDGVYDRDEFDEFIIRDINKLNIDLVVKNGNKKNPNYSGFIEENDSLIIFIKKANNIFNTEKRIIYDSHETPKNFGNNNITGASYKLIQLDERWYYSEIGFD
jgi:NhaP-type Na+/H+ and K+/H+ antiporter